MSTLVDLSQNLMKFWKGCDKINYVYLCPRKALCEEKEKKEKSNLTYSLLDKKCEIFIIG